MPIHHILFATLICKWPLLLSPYLALDTLLVSAFSYRFLIPKKVTLFRILPFFCLLLQYLLFLKCNWEMIAQYIPSSTPWFLTSTSFSAIAESMSVSCITRVVVILRLINVDYSCLLCIFNEYVLHMLLDIYLHDLFVSPCSIL